MAESLEPASLTDITAPEQDLIGDNGKNVKEIVCERCSSVILKPSTCTKVSLDKKFALPHMKKKAEIECDSDSEQIADFWLAEDMFTFENVGFTNTVAQIKYLICADCEIGPIGWHDVNNAKAFYVANSRVLYK